MCRGIAVKNATVEAHPGYITRELVGLGHVGLSLYLSEDDYKVVVIVAGSNDVGYGFTAESIVANISKLVGECRAHGIERVIILGVVEHSRACEKLNDLLYDFCEAEEGIEYCPILDDIDRVSDLIDKDGVHLSKKGDAHVSSGLEDFLASSPEEHS